MFEDYTNRQLLELRSLCIGIVERDDETEETEDALLVLDYIDETLTRWCALGNAA